MVHFGVIKNFREQTPVVPQMVIASDKGKLCSSKSPDAVLLPEGQPVAYSTCAFNPYSINHEQPQGGHESRQRSPDADSLH